jgi:radical SAM-linked protein
MARTKMRIHYAKGDALKYLSHLDLTRLFERAIRRAHLPIAYSEGFHPHPKIAFGPPLPVGLTSMAEYLDIQFTKPLVGDLTYKLGSSLPEGIEILAARPIFHKTESLMAAINIAEYRADLRGSRRQRHLQKNLNDLLAKTHLSVQRVTPKESKRVNIREHLLDLRLGEVKGEDYLHMRLRIGQSGHARPQEILAAILTLSAEELLRIPIQRTSQFIERDGQLISPMEVI